MEPAKHLILKGIVTPLWTCTCILKTEIRVERWITSSPTKSRKCEETTDSIVDRHLDSDSRRAGQPLQNIARIARLYRDPTGASNCAVRARNPGELQRAVRDCGLPVERRCETWGHDSGRLAAH